MHIRLTGRRAVVSGSTAGIGYAIAKGLAAAGAAAVVLNGRSEARVEEARGYRSRGERRRRRSRHR